MQVYPGVRGVLESPLAGQRSALYTSPKRFMGAEGSWNGCIGLRMKLRALFRRRQLEQDLEDELAFHLAMKEKTLGDPAGARRQFGNETRFREICRDLWTFPWLESLWRDLVYGARILARDRAFTAVAVLSLALAIGANTAIFTLVNAALLEKLPVPEPERLVVANWSHGGGRINTSMTNARTRQDPKSGVVLTNVFAYGAFERFRAHARQFSDVFAFTSLNRAALSLQGRTDLVKGMLVSGGYYRGLGVRSLVGRLLDETDDRMDAEPAAVISYQLWRDRFGSDPRAIGARVAVSGVPVTIVGVTRPEFYGVSQGGFMPSPDITLTLAMTPLVDPRLVGSGRSAHLNTETWWLNVMGRLRPGAEARAAETELAALFTQTLDISSLQPADGKLPVLHLLPGDQGLDSVRATYSEPLWILWAVAGTVLLIACANVATLLVARGSARRGEVTMRLALGAGRGRICRQLVTEGLLLSAAAGVLGILFSIWGSRALLGWATSSTDTLRISLGVSARVLGFAAGLTVVVGVLFSLAPALRISRVDLAPALKEGPAGAGSPVAFGAAGAGIDRPSGGPVADVGGGRRSLSAHARQPQKRGSGPAYRGNPPVRARSLLEPVQRGTDAELLSRSPRALEQHARRSCGNGIEHAASHRGHERRPSAGAWRDLAAGKWHPGACQRDRATVLRDHGDPGDSRPRSNGT